MKKISVIILTIVLFVSSFAFTEGLSTEELQKQIAELQAKLAELQGGQSEEASEPVEYETLEKGMKNDNVRKLQERLIELNYLSGGADGDYGGKTKAAVELFQKEAGLDITGIADAATQEKVFAEDAPIAKVYNKLNYKDVLRDPNTYKDEYFTFSGKVFQLVGEQADDDYVYTVLFISADNNSDRLCNVTYLRPTDAPRILEDDQVTVYAKFDDLYTYETVRGNSNTILDFTADTVTVK